MYSAKSARLNETMKNLIDAGMLTRPQIEKNYSYWLKKVQEAEEHLMQFKLALIYWEEANDDG